MWLLCAVLMMGLSACGAPQAAGAGGGSGDAPAASQPPDEAPYVRGDIAAVTPAKPVTTDCVSESDLDPNGSVSSDDPPICNPNPTVFGSIHVKGDTEMVATLGRQVPIMRRAGDGFEPVAFEDLAVGQKVSVWATGPIMESFPVQGAASFVLLED